MLELHEIRRSELDPFFCSMNSDMQVQLANWTEASGNTQYHIVPHRLYKHWEIAVICFAPAMIVLMRGVQDPEEREERVKRAYTERHLSVILRERERAGTNPSSGRSFRHYNNWHYNVTDD